MAIPATFSLDQLDPETRRTAEQAATAAGLSVEEWISTVVLRRAEGPGRPPPTPAARPAEPRGAARGMSAMEVADAIVRRLEAIERQLGEPLRPLTESVAALERRLDALGDLERRAHETTESRLGESLRPLTQSMAALERRLDVLSDLERRAHEAAEQRLGRSIPPLSEAIASVERRLDASDESERRTREAMEQHLSSSMPALTPSTFRLS